MTDQPTVLEMDADQFERRIRAAAPEATFVYHTGALAFDRENGDDKEAVHEIGQRAFALYGQGVCVLIQKQLRSFRQAGDPAPIYEYLAIRREK